MYVKVTIGVSITLLALGVGLGFFGLPRLMKHMIKKQINLGPETDARKIWEKMPFAATFKVYVFNVTNPHETEDGGKPKLQEVGPFVFDEWKDKYDVEDIEEEDAVEFNMRNTFIFRPDLGLSGEEVITMPHTLMQAMAISVKRDKAALLEIVAKGIEAIFEPKSAFVSAPFMDIFFRGINVDCSSSDFAAETICLNFHTGSIKGAVKVNEQLFKFSLMSASNHSDIGRFKVSRGTKNYRQVGTILELDGDEALSTWPGEECNRLHGTDSTIFAPLMKPTDGLWAYSPDLCRSMSPKFEKVLSYANLPAYHYVFDFGDVQQEPDNHCFCAAYPSQCPAKGTMKLNACTETPMIVSLPHFLNGDAKLISDVDGLQPNPDEHSFFIDLELHTGTMLAVTKRLQYSLDVEPVADVPVMARLRPLVMPLFWLEESVQLNKTYTDVLRKQIFLPMAIINTFKWLATLLGAFGCAFALYMFQQRSTDRSRVAHNNEAVVMGSNEKF